MRNALLLALAILVVASLAGCGSSEDKSDLEAPIMGLCLEYWGIGAECCECSSELVLDYYSRKELVALIRGFELMEEFHSENITPEEKKALIKELEALPAHIVMDDSPELDEKIRKKCGEDCL